MSIPQPSIKALSFSEQFKLLDDRTISATRVGDLDLVVSYGEESKTFRVSSHFMRSASPVWHTMLDPDSRFATIKAGTFQLEDNNLEAIFIIFLACHMRYQEVPQSIELDVLMSICIIADKYDCVGVLWPWIDKWVEDNWAIDIRSPTGLNGPEWVFVAWVVGDMDKITTAISELVSTCATNVSGQCLHKSGKVLDDFWPPGLSGEHISDIPSAHCYSALRSMSANVSFNTETILQTRASIIAALVTDCHQLVIKYMDAHVNNPQCRVGNRGSDCDAFVYGHLSKTLRSIKVWPGDPHQIVRNLHSKSFYELIEDIGDIRKRWQNDKTCLSKMHSECGFGHAINRIVDDATRRAGRDIALQDPHCRHMETQWEKLHPSKSSLSDLQN